MAYVALLLDWQLFQRKSITLLPLLYTVWMCQSRNSRTARSLTSYIKGGYCYIPLLPSSTKHCLLHCAKCIEKSPQKNTTGIYSCDYISDLLKIELFWMKNGSTQLKTVHKVCYAILKWAWCEHNVFLMIGIINHTEVFSTIYWPISSNLLLLKSIYSRHFIE